MTVSHYMTANPEISRRVRDRYHNLADVVMIKSIFDSGKTKGIVGMKILDWMIPIKSTQETHRTTSAPRSPNPVVAERESSASRRALLAKEIEKLIEGSKNVEETVEVTSSPLRNDDYQVDPDTRSETKGDKESPKFMPRRKFNELAKNIEDIIMEALPKLVDDRIKVLLKKQVPLYVAEGIILESEKSQADVDLLVRRYISGHILHVHPTKDTIPGAQEQQYQLYVTMKDDHQLRKDDDDPHDDAHHEGENSAKRQKISEHGTFKIGGSYSSQDYEGEPDPSVSVSQELMDEISQTVDEAKLCKVVD
nr:hypothetical protein [Tanacetum cinerariifolium]